MADELVPKSILLETALKAADRLLTQGVPAKPVVRKPKTGFMGALLDRNPLGRRFVYWKARRDTLKKTHGNYPAPLAALEAVKVGLERGRPRGFAEERRRFGELAVGEVSRKLVGIFFATNALKKDDGVAAGVTATARPVEHLAVLGSGFMGAGIAGTAVGNAGIPVRLKDTELPRVGKGLKAATDILAGRLKRRRITRPEFERQAALLSGGTDFAGFQRTDMVIEAVFEDLDVKRKVLADTEAATRGQTIFATNTSTIPIADIAAGASRPGLVVGMHFFSPVDRMPLLEVIPTDRTAPDTIAIGGAVRSQAGEDRDCGAGSPGFLGKPYPHPLSQRGRVHPCRRCPDGGH